LWLEQEIALQTVQIFVVMQQQIDSYNIPTVKASRPRFVTEAEPVSLLPAVVPIENKLEIPINAAAQKKIAEEIELIEKRIVELRQICEIT
ncbi:13453_t:CDS:2, partial [Dentiscutata erythropus]